jgi:hypothetical protein
MIESAVMALLHKETLTFSSLASMVGSPSVSPEPPHPMQSARHSHAARFSFPVHLLMQQVTGSRSELFNGVIRWLFGHVQLLHPPLFQGGALITCCL